MCPGKYSWKAKIMLSALSLILSLPDRILSFITFSSMIRLKP